MEEAEEQGNEEIGTDKNQKTNSNFIERMKDNPWIAATILLAIICIPLIIFNFTGITGNVISGDDAGGAVVEYLNARVGGGVEYVSSEDIGNLYQITVSYRGDNLPVHITKDGSYFVQSAIPMTGQVVDEGQQQQQEGEPDWTIFENFLPDDLKKQILDFELEEPKETDNQRVYEFESYKECKDKLIVFYHSGCGWCTRYYPVLKQAQEDYPELEIYALVLSENREIAEKYRATGTPANIINCKYFASGYMDKDVLYEVLDEFN